MVEVLLSFQIRMKTASFWNGLQARARTGSASQSSGFSEGCGSRYPLITDGMHNLFLPVAIAAQIASVVIVNNAINCLEPSITSQFFVCLPPNVEDFRHEDLPDTPAEYFGGSGVFLATPFDVALHTGTANYLDNVENCVDQTSSGPMIWLSKCYFETVLFPEDACEASRVPSQERHHDVQRFSSPRVHKKLSLASLS